ncbi:MAG: hypothetical protein ACUVWO_09965 [Thermodesulfobacteriota bacterium]
MKKRRILGSLSHRNDEKKQVRRRLGDMRNFLVGVVVGILLFLVFIWFGGGKTVKKIGEDLSETGKKMEVIEEKIKKEKDEIWNGIKKRFLREEKEIKKKGQ